jgi:tyrosinase
LSGETPDDPLLLHRPGMQGGAPLATLVHQHIRPMTAKFLASGVGLPAAIGIAEVAFLLAAFHCYLMALHGASYQVYLNLPEGEDPDPHSVYYAGVLGFFGLKSSQHDSHAQTGAPGGERVFDITDLVARQNAAGVWKGDDPTVTLVVSGVPEKVGERVRINPRANARIGKVEILRQ